VRRKVNKIKKDQSDMPRLVSLPLKAAAVLVTLTTLAPIGIAAAQDYPSKPIRLIIPFRPAAAAT
jgi:hypothetical protein